MENKRTKDTAMKTLYELREKELEELDEGVEFLLTEELLAAVFEQAWRYQFEEDRRTPKRIIRNLVRDTVDEQRLDS